ncbi:hypothetical protein LXL04_023283 [Taraxacum kok-saghyz]
MGRICGSGQNGSDIRVGRSCRVRRIADRVLPRKADRCLGKTPRSGIVAEIRGHCRDHCRDLRSLPRSLPRRLADIREMPRTTWSPRTCTRSEQLWRNIIRSWYVDSGCSRHMTRDISQLNNIHPINGGYVSFAGKEKGKITQCVEKGSGEEENSLVEGEKGESSVKGEQLTLYLLFDFSNRRWGLSIPYRSIYNVPALSRLAIISPGVSCVESINGVKEGKLKATLSFYRPVIKEQANASEFPLISINLPYVKKVEVQGEGQKYVVRIAALDGYLLICVLQRYIWPVIRLIQGFDGSEFEEVPYSFTPAKHNFTPLSPGSDFRTCEFEELEAVPTSAVIEGPLDLGLTTLSFINNLLIFSGGHLGLFGDFIAFRQSWDLFCTAFCEALPHRVLFFGIKTKQFGRGKIWGQFWDNSAWIRTDKRNSYRGYFRYNTAVRGSGSDSLLLSRFSWGRGYRLLFQFFVQQYSIWQSFIYQQIKVFWTVNATYGCVFWHYRKVEDQGHIGLFSGIQDLSISSKEFIHFTS